MLSESESNLVWEKMLAAEVRSLYFADLAARYTKRKQIITGVSFFLSSGAAATLAAKTLYWVPLAMSSISALITAYSIAVGLDRKAATMAKLHSTWNEVRAGYERLWNHWYETDAETQLEELSAISRRASEQAATEAPYDENRIEKWRAFVNQQYTNVRAAA